MNYDLPECFFFFFSYKIQLQRSVTDGFLFFQLGLKITSYTSDLILL